MCNLFVFDPPFEIFVASWWSTDQLKCQGSPVMSEGMPPKCLCLVNVLVFETFVQYINLCWHTVSLILYVCTSALGTDILGFSNFFCDFDIYLNSWLYWHCCLHYGAFFYFWDFCLLWFFTTSLLIHILALLDHEYQILGSPDNSLVLPSIVPHTKFCLSTVTHPLVRNEKTF